MKINFTLEERRYLNGLLLTVAMRTPNLPRAQQRTLKKIASKMVAMAPNLKPMERIAIFHILAVGAGVAQRQQAALEPELKERADQNIKMISEIVEKLGVTNEKPSEVEPRPDTEHAGNG